MDLGQIRGAESINSTCLRFYYSLEALGAKGGCWGTEMGSPMLDSNLNDGTYWRAMELIPNGFGSNERCGIHQQYMLEVALKFRGARSKGWPLGYRDVIPNDGLISQR